MKAPRKIDRIYKINKIDLLPPNLVNPVNPVYFHFFWMSRRDLPNSCRLAISAACDIAFRTNAEVKKGKEGKEEQKRIFLLFFALLALFASILRAIQKERASRPAFSR
jgi:hypothetical protein